MSKAEQAQKIFAEVNGVRADFIKRVTDELSLSKAGASTYFQNCKTKASGGKVKHYYKPKTEKSSEQQTVDSVDDSLEDAEIFEYELEDGTIKCFLSQQELDAFKADLEQQVAA